MIANTFKLCILIVGVCSVYSETFAGFAGGNIQVEQLLSTQFSSLYLEYQSLTQWFQTLQGWGMMTMIDMQNPTGSFEQEDDDDFELEEKDEKTTTTTTSTKGSFEMYPYMGSGVGVGGYGTGFGPYGEPVGVPQAAPKPTRRQFEEMWENSMLIYLKYLHLITARKLEGAQLVHYQSRYYISMLQGYTATNPMASSLLYMLYIRDIMQTLMLSQSIQRQDIWTVWNVLEIMETIEYPNKNDVPSKLNLSIKKAYSTSMRVLLAESMLDFQTVMIDFYLQPILSQAAGAVNGTSFLETESESESASSTESKFYGAGGASYMQYYLLMLKFYAKYTLMTASQSLFAESSMELARHQNPTAFTDAKVISHLPSLRFGGVSGLQQWCQIKLYLVYWDMYMMMMAPQMPHQSTDGPARASNNFVQTEQVATKQVPVTQFEQVQVPVIQNQQVQQEQQVVAPQQIQPIPQEILQQFQIPGFRPSVVG